MNYEHTIFGCIVMAQRGYFGPIFALLSTWGIWKKKKQTPRDTIILYQCTQKL